VRFAKWTADGAYLAYEDGDGGIVVVNARGEVVLTFHGNRPCWASTASRLLYTRNNGATYEFGNPDPIFPTELHELAAGGEAYGGVSDGKLLIRRPGKPDEWIAGAGQPFFDRFGNVVYKTDDHRLNWTRLGGDLAYRDEPLKAVVTSWGHIYHGEGWPRLIWTPDGGVLSSMTDTDIRVRRIGVKEKGWTRRPGQNRNLEHAGVYRDGQIWIACNSGVLEPIDLTTEPTAFTDPIIVVPPPPDPPEPPEVPPVPTDNGIENGVVVNPEAFLMTLLRHYPTRHWQDAQDAMTAINPMITRYGFIQQGPDEWNPNRMYRGRLHLPNVDGPANNWKRNVDFIEHPPGTRWVNERPVPDGPFRWVWHDQGGLAYRPVQPTEPVPIPPVPPLPPPPNGDLAKLQREFDVFKQDTLVRFAKLEQQARKRIALKSAHDRYVAAEPDGRLVADRHQVGAWELFDVEREA